jgi:hypothetical protein
MMLSEPSGSGWPFSIHAGGFDNSTGEYDDAPTQSDATTAQPSVIATDFSGNALGDASPADISPTASPTATGRGATG